MYELLFVNNAKSVRNSGVICHNTWNMRKNYSRSLEQSAFAGAMWNSYYGVMELSGQAPATSQLEEVSTSKLLFCEPSCQPHQYITVSGNFM
jgi:hypothetical protein